MGLTPRTEAIAREKRRRKLERRLIEWCFVLIEIPGVNVPHGFRGAVEDLRASRDERWRKKGEQ